MPPLRRLVSCAGVRSIDPLMVPLAALEIVRAPMTGPRTPAATAPCTSAFVAGESRPSNEPVMVSFVPLSCAETAPVPARLARVLASAATAERRALNASPLSAATDVANPENAIAIAANATRRLIVIGFLFYIEPLLGLGFAFPGASFASRNF